MPSGSRSAARQSSGTTARVIGAVPALRAIGDLSRQVTLEAVIGQASVQARSFRIPGELPGESSTGE
ncbi:MAG: hypothetical protein GXY82_08930 [Methanospirillum sp.]|nr:hypothetical protein [Methanospirillum sp.]